jgi:hypothetical protein
LVGIDRHSQGIPETARAREVVDMSGVKKVETTIGQHKAPPGSLESIGLTGKFLERQYGGRQSG